MGQGTSLAHRKDVDGLRAVAVLAVLFYHFNIGIFPGGFSGVDIFFVISGFVITNSIVSDTSKQKFSIANFYFKRVRRIIPAYVAAILLTTILAYFLLLPQDLVDYANSLSASSAYVSNIYFWKTSGYFSAAAHTKPLLHTWSLSVEEQFYIFAPLLVYFLYRFSKKSRLAALVPIIVASLILSVAAVFVAPTAGFYLLPTRAWELFLGVTLALVSWRGPSKPVLREAIAAIGAMFIIIGLLTLREDDPFPGWSALWPCLGAALLIQAGNGFSSERGMPFVNRVISTTPFVWIGLISYSLYLVHWPLAAFARYELLRDLSLLEGIAMIAVSVLLAAVSWKFIEQPFRNISPGRARSVLAAGAAAVVAGVMFGVSGTVLKGLPGRFPDFAEQTITGTEDWGGDHCFNQNATAPLDWDEKQCTRIHGSKGRILIWGDSFAAQYMPGILRNAKSIDADVLQYTFAGCPPILDYFSYARVGCSTSNRRVLSVIREAHVDTVVLAARWTDVPRHTLNTLPETISELKKLGVRVYVIGQSPQFAMDVQRIDYISGARMKPGTYSWEVFFDKDYNKTLGQLASGATFINPMTYLCEGSNCAYRKDHDYYYADYGHFSTVGSTKAVAAYFPAAGAEQLSQLGAVSDFASKP